MDKLTKTTLHHIKFCKNCGEIIKDQKTESCLCVDCEISFEEQDDEIFTREYV